MKNSRIAFLLMTFAIVQQLHAQTIGNDTLISVFSLTPQVGNLKDTTTTVILPDSSLKYERILLHYGLDQPPGGWDPWDRIGYVRVFTQTDTFEIARIMTPYSKACSWIIDVTDFRSILTGSVNINSFILFYASTGQGYLVSMSLQFIGGNPLKEAYAIKNLWKNDVFNRWEYGNYQNPLADHLLPHRILIDPQAEEVRVKINLTGHGQGNTDNAAEFCNKTHQLTIDSAASIPHNLWRANCGTNPCSPQSGTWQYNRAGWCPGADVIPWEADITSFVIPGDSITLSYVPLPYRNYCSPTDSNCVNGITCTDCNYNSNGHVMPWYLMQSQIVFYHQVNLISGIKQLPFSLFSIAPNPVHSTVKIKSKNGTREKFRLSVFDMLGKCTFHADDLWDESEIDMSTFEKGVYLVKIGWDNYIQTAKIIKF